LWILGYPDAALADAEHAFSDAREINQAANSLNASLAIYPVIFCGNYAAAKAKSDELMKLAEEKGAPLWKAAVMAYQGLIADLTGKASDAVQKIGRGISAYRSTRARAMVPLWLSHLGRAYAELGQFEDARRSISEAIAVIETTGERWCEAEINRVAGEIVLKSPEQDTAKAQAYFERALAVARKQQAKSWELRSAVSMARLWRDQGKRDEARNLLALVYGWFTEGFDTLDLKEAKVLLDELA
jgi:predicted ATPase